MANLPDLPDFAARSYVDADGVTQEIPAGENPEYRNLFLMALADVPSTSSQEDIDSLFLCPITATAMLDPVITPSGQTYEREAIEEWIKQEQNDPMDRRPLTVAQLRSNTIVCSLTKQYQSMRVGEPLPVGMDSRTLDDVLRRFKDKMEESVQTFASVLALPPMMMASGASGISQGNFLGGTSMFASGAASSVSQPATLACAAADTVGNTVSAVADGSSVLSQQSLSQGDGASGEVASESSKSGCP